MSEINSEMADNIHVKGNFRRIIGSTGKFFRISIRDKPMYFWVFGYPMIFILLFSIGLAILLQIGVVYIPFLQTAFHTVPLTLSSWGLVVLAAGGLFALEETRKAFLPKLFSFGKYEPITGSK